LLKGWWHELGWMRYVRLVTGLVNNIVVTKFPKSY
jgi:hypothetical protein